MGKLLTVEEFAAYYRTTTTTVYRWLKQQKLSAVKIGREWRIDIESSIPSGKEQNVRHDEIWNNLDNSEHVMLLAKSKEKVYEAEASFFKYALEHDKKMMKGCWWQDPDEVEEKLTSYGLDIKNMVKDGVFKVVDFNRLYKKYGVSGPVERWRNEIYANRRNSLWASGSPCVESCGNEKSLLEFETQLNKAIRDMPVTGICSYYSSEFRSDGFSKLTTLIQQHSGIIFYDGNRSELLRH